MDIMAVLSFSELKAHFIRSPYLMPEILIFRPDLVDYPVQLGLCFSYVIHHSFPASPLLTSHCCLCHLKCSSQELTFCYMEQYRNFALTSLVL